MKEHARLQVEHKYCIESRVLQSKPESTNESKGEKKFNMHSNTK